MLEPLPLPKSRLEALTDGIFAVSMTLLVLDLKLPEHIGADTSQVIASLLRLLPYVDDYVISFVVLCLYWLTHLRLMQRVRDVDGAFVWLNLGFLLSTTFVPPLTSLIGNNPGQPVAAIVYGGNLLLLLLFEALLWRRGALHLSNETVVDGAALWAFMRSRFLFAGGVIVLAIVAALVEIEFGTKVGYATYVYLLLIVVGVARPRHAPSPVRHRHPPAA
ncbi:MAG: TMEM175 family protein [Burkholderiales bacterium]